MLTPYQCGQMMILVVLWLMIVFSMGHVQVFVGRVALIVYGVMTNTEYTEDLLTGKLIQT